MATLMKCGHVAQAIDDSGNPVCMICADIKPGWNEPADEEPDLNGRTAICRECGKRVPSSLELTFFKYSGDNLVDSYYCGCFGWD